MRKIMVGAQCIINTISSYTMFVCFFFILFETMFHFFSIFLHVACCMRDILLFDAYNSVK